MRFKLKSGVFEYHGKLHKAGEVFESNHDLCKIFKNKFEAIPDGMVIPAVKVPVKIRRIVPSKVNDKEAAAPASQPTASSAEMEAKVQAEVRRRLVLPVPPPPPVVPPVTSKESGKDFGMNVTPKYPTAVKHSLRVFRKGTKYSLVTKDGSEQATDLSKEQLIDELRAVATEG